ncbi:hypothetical protein OG413_43705 [Streptomyces sp. NBC_01433]|uniref:hypothetical protein n=1 Tax=Streptomyces sp. NBC_01433 TaxID=2903864 RepID=UPI002255F5F1|nr:hypothetical protein [Streptomyces sp. NBC_01433]MCX4682091.1 hypothetical protein [Streptomyces sp. NBC_01433]
MHVRVPSALYTPSRPLRPSVPLTVTLTGDLEGLPPNLFEAYEAQPFSKEHGAFRGGRPMAAETVLDTLRLHLRDAGRGGCSGTASGHILTVQCGPDGIGWRFLPRAMTGTVDRMTHALLQADIQVLKGPQPATGVRLYAVPDDPDIVEVRPVVDGLERLPTGGEWFNTRRQHWVQLMASARAALSGNGWYSCGGTLDGTRFAARPQPVTLTSSGLMPPIPQLAATYEVETRWPESDWALQPRESATSLLKGIYSCLRKGVATVEAVGSTIYETSVTASDFAPYARFTPVLRPEPARAA